ncbi:peptide deformylase [Hymenobacter chitinivorans]|uniref:Peptide deformylase n=1 Tax=Hymenobacter chitinivorans DSM 11115 TaxID=1121954 RepID=A0A2M9BRB1_9BACT|nr:peptide deformylase [Hymenobacter chitinivorans]PJJ60468.1 peptide deformylase [Hymenobacter chitinivorans DSM 11115]
MPIREILQLGHPVLREVAAPVADPTAPDVAALVTDLTDTVAHWRETTGYGRAIAAPQIGVLQRVILLRLPGHPVWALINPSIVEHSPDTIEVWDACLSFLSIFMRVTRYPWIRVRYQDLRGAWHETHAGAEDDLAELLQHEIDHLDGILALDRLTDVKSICSRQEFERQFKSSSPYGR